jgi:hypothetical protein
MTLQYEQVAALPTSFYERNEDSLNGLLETLNLPLTDGSLSALVQATQPWVRGDHGHNGNDFPFDLSKQSELPEYYERFGLTDRVPLAPGHYNQLLVFGAVHHGNDRRLRFLSEMLADGVSTDHIVLLGGERTMFAKDEPDNIIKTLESLEAKGTSDPWLEYFLGKPANETNETDMLRLAALDYLGPLMLKSEILSPEPEYRALTSTPVLRYEFNWQGMPLTLMHTRAIKRKDGLARHTTEACVADWVRTFRPVDGSRVAIICAQPHLERMAKTVRRALGAVDTNIEVVAGGPAVSVGASHNIHLGEVARNLYEDLQIVTDTAC